MTREEALVQLRLGPGINEDVSEEYNEAVNMAVEALQQQQPNEDCISRKAALDGLANIAKAKAKSDAQKSLMGRVMFFVEQLPSVIPQPKTEPQQKTGHWTHDGSNWTNRWICSECGYKLYDEQSRFCPDCGVKMESEAE